MTLTTPRGYPYPEGTDLLGDTHTAMQALAQAVDDDLGEWQTLTLLSGWAAAASGFLVPRYRKVAGIVHLEGFVEGESSTAPYFGLLPAGFRPPSNLLTVQLVAGAGGRLDVNADGYVTVPSWTAPVDYVSFSLMFGAA